VADLESSGPPAPDLEVRPDLGAGPDLDVRADLGAGPDREALHYWSARRLRDAMSAGELSAREVLEHHLARIEAVNPAINAIVTLVPEQARAAADALDRRRAGGVPTGPLHGLPIAIKDLMDTAGIRTTYGSPVYRDHVPARDALMVSRLRDAGAIIIGKTNTPEFGAGSHTFNAVFGATHNPYDPSRSAGGSSGGAAAALAAGLVPLADGSDLGGSVRNPASFCNVVGLRPSLGRVASTRPGNAWDPMSLLGPMARSVDDAALMLAAIAGPDPRTPVAIEEDPAQFAQLTPRSLAGVRVAWSETVSGLPVEPAVTAALAPARTALEALGAVLEEREPDLSGADEVFETFRALEFFAGHGDDAERHPELIKPEVRQDVAWGRALTAAQIAAAGALRTELFRRTVALLEEYDLLALPTSQLLPFPVSWRSPHQVAGVAMERYYTWQRSCTRISATTLPALSLPTGFSADGLPVGLQLVGRHRGEAALMSYAMSLETALGAGRRRPPLTA
jgi:amidase